jgi:hypothetical protein
MMQRQTEALDEDGLPLFIVAQKTTLAIGVVGCRGPLDAHVVGRSLLAYSRSKKSPTEKLHSAPSFHQT